MSCLQVECTENGASLRIVRKEPVIRSVQLIRIERQRCTDRKSYHFPDGMCLIYGAIETRFLMLPTLGMELFAKNGTGALVGFFTPKVITGKRFTQGPQTCRTSSRFISPSLGSVVTYIE